MVPLCQGWETSRRVEPTAGQSIANMFLGRAQVECDANAATMDDFHGRRAEVRARNARCSNAYGCLRRGQMRLRPGRDA